MGQDRQIKNIWESRSIGKNTRGRPREKWISTVEIILSREDVNAAKQMARDCKE